ncbi:MAG TPA: hypothetical protein VMG08_11895 [Allosphingosinicella sp.]|nr:hypothetical protein [Allosphingosinicella sp.]
MDATTRHLICLLGATAGLVGWSTPALAQQQCFISEAARRQYVATICATQGRPTCAMISGARWRLCSPSDAAGVIRDPCSASSCGPEVGREGLVNPGRPDERFLDPGRRQRAQDIDIRRQSRAPRP